jgi:hypothetical protein
MPKFSIYVPDDLWASAQAAQPEAKPSPLVQTALRRLVDAESRKSYAALPADVLAERERVLAIVTREARESYVEGYRIGLEFIEEFEWEAIEDFRRLEWSVDNWADSLDDRETPVPGEADHVWTFDTFWRYRAGEHMSSILNALERPTGVIREGFVDAFRDVLTEATQAIRHVAPQATVADPAGDPDPAEATAKEETE